MMINHLSGRISDAFGRRQFVLAGRGTTALWLALRAIARRTGPGEVVVPDILCVTALEGVLLAGFKPVFADVTPDRFTLAPDRVAQLITPQTRAVLVAHLFGHIADVEAIRAAAPGIPLIEDAVQGLGGHYQGRPTGTLGDLSFISFDSTKMIRGRGGVLLFDDPSLHQEIDADLSLLRAPPQPPVDVFHELLPPAAAEAYRKQLWSSVPSLLRPFDPSPANLERILGDWQTLAARVAARNAKARILRERLSGLPLTVPDVRAGDAIWRYTFAAPTAAQAQWIAHGLQRAGLSGSTLYYPLSRLFGQPTQTGALANRLVNLWVDCPEADVVRALDIVISAMSR